MIRKVNYHLPEFKNNWSFEGYIGPLPKQSNEVSNTTWFHIAALFASVRQKKHII